MTEHQIVNPDYLKAVNMAMRLTAQAHDVLKENPTDRQKLEAARAKLTSAKGALDVAFNDIADALGRPR